VGGFRRQLKDVGGPAVQRDVQGASAGAKAGAKCGFVKEQSRECGEWWLQEQQNDQLGDPEAEGCVGEGAEEQPRCHAGVRLIVLCGVCGKMHVNEGDCDTYDCCLSIVVCLSRVWSC